MKVEKGYLKGNPTIPEYFAADILELQQNTDLSFRLYTNENRAERSDAASLISSGRDDAEIVVLIVGSVPVHVRARRVGIAEVREAASGIDVVFVSRHPGLRRSVRSSWRRRLVGSIMCALRSLFLFPAPA